MTKAIKILILILLVIALAIGAGVFLFIHNKSASDQAIEGDYESYKYGDQTFYEPDYSNGNSETNIGSLTYAVPSTYTPVQSSDDSLTEHVYVNLNNGARIAISEQHGKDAKFYEDLSAEYLDGVSNVQEIQIGDVKGYRYDYVEGNNVLQSGFHFISGESFYAGIILVLDESSEEVNDDYVPTPLTDDMVEDFNSLCNSLSLQ